MYRSYGTRKKICSFFRRIDGFQIIKRYNNRRKALNYNSGYLFKIHKSAAIKLTEPTALLGAENLWVMDRVQNLRQV